MEYECTTRDAEGRASTHRVRAGSTRLAARKLQEQGHVVTSVCPARATRKGGRWALALAALRAPSPRVMATFFHMLQSCLHAGMTTFDAVAQIERDLHDHRLRAALAVMAPRLAAGETLAAQLARFPGLFRPHVVALCQTGEETGCLEQMVGEIAESYEVDDRISRSLRWPVGILLVSVLPLPALWRFFHFMEYLALFIVTPEKAPAFEGSPWRAAIQMWLRKDALVAAAGTLLVAALFAGGWMVARYPGRLSWRDRLALRLPQWAALARGCAQRRFARVAHAAHRAGLPFADVLQLAAVATANAVYEDRLLPHVDAVREGASFAETVRSARVLPDLLASALVPAEKAGDLEPALLRTATTIEGDLEDVLRGATARSWFVLIFWAIVLPALASIHLYKQYLDFAFSFADSLME